MQVEAVQEGPNRLLRSTKCSATTMGRNCCPQGDACRLSSTLSAPQDRDQDHFSTAAPGPTRWPGVLAGIAMSYSPAN